MGVNGKHGRNTAIRGECSCGNWPTRHFRRVDWRFRRFGGGGALGPSARLGGFGSTAERSTDASRPLHDSAARQPCMPSHSDSARSTASATDAEQPRGQSRRQAQGKSFAMAAAAAFDKPAITELARPTGRTTTHMHLAPTFGVILAALGLPGDVAARLYLYIACEAGSSACD